MHVAHGDVGERIKACAKRRQREDRRRAGEKARDARDWPVVVGEGERLGMAHPALERGAQLILQSLGDEDVRRCAGAAVQIFVAAANGEVAAAAVEVEFDRARAVRQVPDSQRAGAMRGLIDRRHVVDGGGAIIDVGRCDDGGILIDCTHNFPGRDRIQPQAEHFGQPLRDI